MYTHRNLLQTFWKKTICYAYHLITDHVRNEEVLESRSRGMSYMKYVNGRRTGLVTF